MSTTANPSAKKGASAIPETKLRRPRDIIFVLDSSGSISDEDFNRALMFTRRIVGLLDISQTGTRVAMVNYGTNAKVEFSLHHHSQEEEIRKAITKVDPLGGSTRTSEALEKVIKICEHRHNTKNPLIVILITDGHSDNRARAIQMATALKQRWGAHFFAVGVGSAVNQTELGNLASSKENVLLVDSYRALKHVRERVTIKACIVVPRPKLNMNVTSLGPARKLVLIGPNPKTTDDPASCTNDKVIEFLKSTDPDAVRTKIVYVSFQEDSKISETDRDQAQSENITLVGSKFPMGCTDQPSISDFDIFTTAFYQSVLHSPVFSDVTHIIGQSPLTANAMHNIANAIEGKPQIKPKRLLVFKSEKPDGNTKKCLELADVILSTSDAVTKSFLDQDLPTAPEILPFNLTTPLVDITTKDEQEPQADVDDTSQKDETGTSREMAKTEAVINPEMIFLNILHAGIKLDINLTTNESTSDISNLKLKAARNVVGSLLHVQHLGNSADVIAKMTQELCISNQVVETWLKFITETEISNRKILRVDQNGDLSLRISIFCINEESVKDLWEQFQKDKPLAIALDTALRTSDVSYETCEISIKSEVNEELVGFVVLTSEEYVKLVTSVITRRKKEQDRAWTTAYGSERDRNIAKEVESRRLEKKWEAILDEARSLMGERGVDALEKARDQCDNDAEFIARIEASMEAGSFMEFLKDLISNLCRVM